MIVALRHRDVVNASMNAHPCSQQCSPRRGEGNPRSELLAPVASLLLVQLLRDSRDSGAIKPFS